ncbi:hypothetical protein EDD16DRAFT_1596636, partial [Pisolithus croceorrhizus]
IDLVWRKRKSWITGFHFFLGMPFLANSWIAPLWIAFQTISQPMPTSDRGPDGDLSNNVAMQLWVSLASPLVT